jgi:hypothetical protein
MDSWQLVHFIRHLPKISSQELEEMKRYNPISEMERMKDAEIEQFLSTGEAGGGVGHQH